MKSYQAKSQPAGEYRIHWDGRDVYGTEVSSGVYLYAFKVANTIQMRKMLLIR